MNTIAYNREAAVAYAQKWAFSRNPAYYNFDLLGGDCTNFASQCLFAGSGVINSTREVGWYYNNLSDRAAAWTGVEFFHRFLVGNAEGIGDGTGPFAREVSLADLEIGDFLQLGRETGDFYHNPVVIGFRGEMPLLAAHTYDTYNRPLSAYRFERLRCLHIIGVRKP